MVIWILLKEDILELYCTREAGSTCWLIGHGSERERRIIKDQWVCFEEPGRVLRYWPGGERLTEIHYEALGSNSSVFTSYVWDASSISIGIQSINQKNAYVMLEFQRTSGSTKHGLESQTPKTWAGLWAIYSSVLGCLPSTFETLGSVLSFVSLSKFMITQEAQRTEAQSFSTLEISPAAGVWWNESWFCKLA